MWYMRAIDFYALAWPLKLPVLWECCYCCAGTKISKAVFIVTEEEVSERVCPEDNDNEV